MKNKIILSACIVLFIGILILANQFMNNNLSENNNTNLESDNTNNQDDTVKQKVIHVTSDSFEKEVLQSEKPVLIDFYADWCVPCQMLAPTIEEIANENDNIKVVKVNVDEAESLAIEYGAYSIPTLVVVNNGTEVNRVVGLVEKEVILKLLP